MSWLSELIGRLKPIPPILGPPVVLDPKGIPAEDTQFIKSLDMLRSRKKLKPMDWDSDLDRIAQAHSVYQLSRGMVSHDGFAQRLKAYGQAAENAAMTWGEQPYQGWYNSPGHYRNMIGDYNRVGIGVANNANGQYYWTAVFAKV